MEERGKRAGNIYQNYSHLYFYLTLVIYSPDTLAHI